MKRWVLHIIAIFFMRPKITSEMQNWKKSMMYCSNFLCSQNKVQKGKIWKEMTIVYSSKCFLVLPKLISERQNLKIWVLCVVAIFYFIFLLPKLISENGKIFKEMSIMYDILVNPLFFCFVLFLMWPKLIRKEVKFEEMS